MKDYNSMKKYKLIIVGFMLVLLLSKSKDLQAQVLVHEYTGKVSVYPSKLVQSQQLGEELTTLRKLGINKIIRHLREKYSWQLAEEVRIDTLDIKLEIEKIDSIIKNSKSTGNVVKRDVSGRPTISIYDEDTTYFDEHGRVQSIRSGSMDENGGDEYSVRKVFYTPTNIVREYDNEEFCGQSAKLTYDNSGKIKFIDYVFHPSDLSDKRGRHIYEYSKDGLVMKKTLFGDLVVKKKKNGEEDYKFVDKLVFRAESKYVYIR